MSAALSPPPCLGRAAQPELSGPAAAESRLRSSASAGGAAESNMQNLSHSSSLIATERPGEGQAHRGSGKSEELGHQW